MRYWEIIAPLQEDASCGASSAASVATAVQPFMSPNPSGDQGIYAAKPKKKVAAKPVVLRRNPISN